MENNNMNTIQVNNNIIVSSFKVTKKANIISLSDTEVSIIYNNSNEKLIFNISGSVLINEYYYNSNIETTYEVEKDSIFKLNRFVVDCSLTSNININTSSKVHYKYSNININDNKYIVNINHVGKNSISEIINHGLNILNNKLDYIINTNIKKESININAKQDNTIILMGDNNSSIKPNLLVNNNDIDASHSAYLGKFKKEEIFYLMSRGINKKESIKLLAKAFLINSNKNYYWINEVINNLNIYWRCEDE